MSAQCFAKPEIFFFFKLIEILICMRRKSNTHFHTGDYKKR